MSAPVISVVIAAYNAQDTLTAQLRALAAQQVDGEWEVLVCDNGSTDATADVARRSAEFLPRVRLVDASARRGPGAARNAGARASRAPLLAFCDADDVVAEGWVTAMIGALGRAPFVTGRSRRPEFNARPGDAHTFSWGRYRVPYFPYLPGAGAGNMGVHRDAFLEVGGFDDSMRTGEDLDLAWRMQLAGHELIEEPRAVVYVSNREGLGATIAQTFAYGVGDRRLAHKYALVAAAYRREGPRARAEAPETSTAATSAAPAASGSASASGIAARVWRKARSLRRPSDLTNIVRTAATWAGFRFGRVSGAAPQVAPPAQLPPTWFA
jgi:glycosyltransferase involved in cell wall biosynthesis